MNVEIRTGDRVVHTASGRKGVVLQMKRQRTAASEEARVKFDDGSGPRWVITAVPRKVARP